MDSQLSVKTRSIKVIPFVGKQIYTETKLSIPQSKVETTPKNREKRDLDLGVTVK